MPNDTLGEEVTRTVKGATDFLRSQKSDERLRDFHLLNLATVERRLVADIDERSNRYLAELNENEGHEVDARWAALNKDLRFTRINTEQAAHQQSFDALRQANGGAFPRNISPVLYWIPLILLGLAEWYVNYSTFAEIFIPLLAIAGTLIVAAVFATASHVHGTFIKQLSEIYDPSVETRRMLNRKIAFVAVTILLLVAFVVITVMRYQVIAEELGRGFGQQEGTFGGASNSTILSKLLPAVLLNVFIWGIGAVYAWAMHERIPELRESYRNLQSVNARLDKARRPVMRTQEQIKARFDRERSKNTVAIREYQSLLDSVRATADRIRADVPSGRSTNIGGRP